MNNNVVDSRPNHDVHASRLYDDLVAVINKHIETGKVTVAATIGLLQIVQMDVWGMVRGAEVQDEKHPAPLVDEPEPTEPCIVTKTAVVPIKRRTPPYADILDLWREILPELPQPQGVEHWTDARKTQIRSRWNDELPELEDWRRMMIYIRKSDFLMGRTQTEGRKPFRCHLFWIIKPEKLLLLSEGFYHERSAKNGA